MTSGIYPVVQLLCNTSHYQKAPAAEKAKRTMLQLTMAQHFQQECRASGIPDVKDLEMAYTVSAVWEQAARKNSHGGWVEKRRVRAGSPGKPPCYSEQRWPASGLLVG